MLCFSMIYSNQLKGKEKESNATNGISIPKSDLDLYTMEQISGLEDYEEPYTQPNGTHSSRFRMEGFFMDKSQFEKDHRLELSFHVSSDFESMPPAFLKWDDEESAYVLDLYEIHLGGTILDKIEEEPIFKMTAEEKKLDLNKDIPGMDSDFHNVLQLKFFVNGKPDCQIMRDPSGKIFVNFEWKDEAERAAWLSKLNFWK